jgi:hypothetical protein
LYLDVTAGSAGQTRARRSDRERPTWGCLAHLKYCSAIGPA